jgi:hypothetical protein
VLHHPAAQRQDGGGPSRKRCAGGRALRPGRPTTSSPPRTSPSRTSGPRSSATMKCSAFGDAAWNLYGLGLRTATADVNGTYKDVTAALGVRCNDISLVPGRIAPRRRAPTEVPQRQCRVAARIRHTSTRLEPLGREEGTKVENPWGGHPFSVRLSCWSTWTGTRTKTSSASRSTCSG